jgi:site-specific recombinase XerD
MNTTKNSRTTPATKNVRCGSPLGRQQKENFYLKPQFITYLQNKNIAPTSLEGYLWNIQLFLAWVEKEETQIKKTDVLNYLEHLKNQRKQKNKSRSLCLNAMNHYFTFLLKKEATASNPCALIKIRATKQTSRYRIYSPEELTALCDNFYNVFVRTYDDSHVAMNQRLTARLTKERNHVILSLLIHQGTTTKEIDTIELDDLDLMNATLKLRGNKKSNDRVLALQATQIGVLMHYLHTIRPQFLEYHQDKESQRLFLSLPEYGKKFAESNTIMRTYSTLKTQLKTIDTHFVNFSQIRASVITNWLKVHGLRKTQVMAGHRYITSTESYLSNDLEQLTTDITKLHPFL